LLNNNTKARVIICDDHPIFRKGLMQIINEIENINLVGECGDGKTALKLIQDFKPDIAILDILMPDKNGLEVARQVKEDGLSTRIIILTMHSEETYFNEAMDAGVSGYLLKENASTDLKSCIKEVLSGKYYVSSLLSNLLLEREKRIKSLQKDIPAIESLTETELKIIKLIAKNKTSKEIAQEMFISYRTVQNHRQHISDKLNLHGPHKLLQFAFENKSLFIL
jgi:two-component system, NarL family, response regulator DegU